MNIKHQTLKKTGWIVFYLYIILLSYFLFFSDYYGRAIASELRYNLEPFKEIKRFIQYRHQLGVESFVVNILGNVLAFAPFGFFLPLLNRHYRCGLIVTILTGVFSLMIEFLQLNFKVGVFDVDDMILNTLGGLIGYICYRIFVIIYRRMRRKENNAKITNQ